MSVAAAAGGGKPQRGNRIEDDILRRISSIVFDNAGKNISREMAKQLLQSLILKVVPHKHCKTDIYNAYTPIVEAITTENDDNLILALIRILLSNNSQEIELVKNKKLSVSIMQQGGIFGISATNLMGLKLKGTTIPEDRMAINKVANIFCNSQNVKPNEILILRPYDWIRPNSDKVTFITPSTIQNYMPGRGKGDSVSEPNKLTPGELQKVREDDSIVPIGTDISSSGSDVVKDFKKINRLQKVKPLSVPEARAASESEPRRKIPQPTPQPIRKTSVKPQQPNPISDLSSDGEYAMAKLAEVEDKIQSDEENIPIGILHSEYKPQIQAHDKRVIKEQKENQPIERKTGKPPPQPAQKVQPPSLLDEIRKGKTLKKTNKTNTKPQQQSQKSFKQMLEERFKPVGQPSRRSSKQKEAKRKDPRGGRRRSSRRRFVRR